MSANGRDAPPNSRDEVEDGLPDPGPERVRIDKWLWHARFFKSRSLAARLCNAGGVRMAGAPVTKAHHVVKPGDVLTFAQGGHVRIVRIAAIGNRRGPPSEASTLYEDLAPPSADTALPRRR